MDEAKVTPIENGPLEVRGVANCLNSRGEALAVQNPFYLCRCGGSKNKPFCDGTHKKIGFSSAREQSGPHGRTKDYAGRAFTIHDNRSVCAHAAACTEHSPAVFRSGARPWIDADGEPAERAMETIRRCPSGALSYTHEGKRLSRRDLAPGVRILKDGPYAVAGVPLAFDPPPLEPGYYTLCRCGASKNKPYCDGSHWAVKFSDPRN